MPSSAEPITNRQLNRATLERQLLLRRASMPLTTAVEKLVGLQAQNPLDPYLALWSRVEGFEADALGRLLLERSLVRMTVMRGTIHLLTVDDALWLRPLTQPVLTAELSRHREFAPALAGVDLEPIMAVARQLLSNTPLSGPRLRALLADRFPQIDPAALAYACRCLLPLVQAPPRGVWGRTRQAEVVTAILPVVRDLRRGGAAAIDLCSVAAGRLDAFYERGLQVWDYAAGALIATEAGAWVGDLHGGPPSSAFTLAAGPPLFDPLRLLLDGAGAATA